MKKYKNIAFFAVLLTSLPLKYSYAGLAFTDGCAFNDIAQQSACVEQKMNKVELALRVEEEAALVEIQQWDEAPSISLQSQNRLKASARTYRIYRGAQCGLIESLAEGNSMAQEIAGMVCICDLNMARTNLLNNLKDKIPRRDFE